MYSRPNVYSRVRNRRRVGNKRRAGNNRRAWNKMCELVLKTPKKLDMEKITVFNKRMSFNKAIGPGKIQN